MRFSTRFGRNSLKSLDESKVLESLRLLLAKPTAIIFSLGTLLNPLPRRRESRARGSKGRKAIWFSTSFSFAEKVSIVESSQVECELRT